MPRNDSVLAAANLVRAGFTDGEGARERLLGLGEAAEPLAPLLAATADPDLALRSLVGLVAALPKGNSILDVLVDEDGTAMRLFAVLGMSEAMGEHLARHPDQWEELRDPTLGSTRPARFAVREALLRAVGADSGTTPVAGTPYDAALDALRVEYRRFLLRLMSRDLAHNVGVDDVAAELSDLAAGTLEAALAIARAKVGDAAHRTRLAVIAMGKCGGNELNYVSDVDVIFVAEPVAGEDGDAAMRAATAMASTLMRVCSDQTGEGTIWPVDANLRPEGRSGPLVRTLDSHLGYYERWAKTWEFQALLKARAIAGDAELGADYEARIGPLVWSASARPGFVEDVQSMRRRVLDHIPAKESERQLKLGAGGLRDVEFAVQLMQLVHGRHDPEVRARATLSALSELTAQGYVGREDGQALHTAYAFLRRLEHRMQMYRLRRLHVIPGDEASLRRLGRSLGYFKDSAAELERALEEQRREVRRLHEKLFYRPLLESVARVPSDRLQQRRLSLESAREMLTALGYADPAGALRHLEALTTGVSRASTIQRALLPLMLVWFGDAPDPDAGLFGFRRISEALGGSHWYLAALRDEGRTAERLAMILATSRYATDLLEREPEGVRILGETGALEPLSRDAIRNEMAATATRRDSAEDAVKAIRGIRRRELLRVSAADLCEPFGVAEVGYALTDLTDATLEATLAVAERSVAAERGIEPPTRMAVVAMGRYGGQELGYGSDADVMFVHDPWPDADPGVAASYAKAVANEIRRLLVLPATDPPLEVDADLRPEGKNGPLVRTIDSYAAYYAKWSAVWEAQALLRADPVAGDADLKDRFGALIDPLRYPEAGLSDDDVLEIRRIKARVDSERLPRGADPALHLKLGRGGLADVEWTVQLLQLRHAHAVPGLRTTKTLDALDACVEAELMPVTDATALREAWLFASRARNAITQVRGRGSDQWPTHPRERAAVARVLHYPPGSTDEMLNDYQRTARRARQTVDRLFWN